METRVLSVGLIMSNHVGFVVKFSTQFAFHTVQLSSYVAGNVIQRAGKKDFTRNYQLDFFCSEPRQSGSAEVSTFQGKGRITKYLLGS